MEAEEAPITYVIQHYFPHWAPPDNKKDWNLALCPSHAEDRPSFSVNFEEGAAKCFACDFGGSVISIIRKQEGGSYAQAVSRAEEISGGRYDSVQRKSPRKRGRRVFGEQGSHERSDRDGGQQVPSRIRGRRTPWT